MIRITQLLVLILSIHSVFGQSLADKIPVDPMVKIGKLDNGLTYYLRKNDYPKDRVELRLVVNAGSMQEDNDQLGLAHFLEHMAFNGSENFEKNELVDFLQSIGVQFGADLNAYTSFDETVYILPIASDDEAILMKGLTVLKDWAMGLSFDPEEIDKERGVVIEEWRLGQGAQQRMRDKFFPILFKDSRYAERLPIGTKEIIENAPYGTIKKFYEDWYRPDLMAVVAVGDMDLEKMEAEIKKRFSRKKQVTNPRTKESRKVPSHKETLVSIVSDVENAFTAVQLIYKNPASKSLSLKDFRKSYLYVLYNRMLNSRLQELTQQAKPPFIFGQSNFGSLVRSTDNYSSFAVAGETEILNALQTLVIENARVKKHGFNQTELDRAITGLSKELESYAKEKDKTESEAYVSEYINNYLNDEPIPGIEFEYSFFQEIANGITIEEINGLATRWITEENRVIIVTGVDKEGVELPTEQQVLAAVNEVDLVSITPYDDEISTEAFIDKLPAAGKVVDSVVNETVDISEITLSNGLKVVVKSTDFKNDEILMSSFSLGGHSLYSNEDYQSASMAANIIKQSGIKNISLPDLKKRLAGKNVQVSPFIGGVREGISGSSTPEDFETLLQLTHLYFTQPRKDEAVFQSIISRNKLFFQNLMVNPQYFYSDQVSKIMAQNHPRGGGFPTPEQMDEVSLDRAYDIFRERFSNAGEFTFFFVGNIDLKEHQSLLEKYLGSLPATSTKETWKDLGIRPPKGKVEEKIYRGTDPKSLVTLSFVGEAKLSKKERYLLGSFADVLENRLIDVLRENESGVYTVNVSNNVSTIPYDNYKLTISFPCSPENVDKLLNASFNEIKEIQKSGVTDEDLMKVKEADTKNREENLKKNNYWIGQLTGYYMNEKDLNDFYKYEELIQGLNSKDLKNIAKKYIDADEFIKIVLYPEE